MKNYLITFHAILAVVCVVLNAFGIFCLSKQSGRNPNQRCLLQNLSTVEILKAIYDLMSQVIIFIINQYKQTWAWWEHYLGVDTIGIIFLSQRCIFADNQPGIYRSIRFFGQKLNNCLATAQPQIWHFLQKQLVFTKNL